MKFKILFLLLFVIGFGLIEPSACLQAADVRDIVQQGRRLAQKGKWDKAIKKYRKALQTDPKFALAHWSLGEALEKEKDWEGAIAEYRKALELRPHDAYWHLAVGDILRKMGNDRAALELYGRAFELAPEDSGIRFFYEELRETLASEKDQSTRGTRDLPEEYKVGEGPSPPQLVYGPAPSYSKEARGDKVVGIVGLIIVVDEKGNVRNVRVFKPLGYGLDQQAKRTVRTWKFKPATRKGKPVPFLISVEVKFNLF